MARELFSAKDREQIEEQGLSIEGARRQIELCSRPPMYARLVRPCTAGDGIRVLDEAEVDRLGRVWEKAARACHAVKFVPASGAASRMFKVPLLWLHRDAPVSRAALQAAAEVGDPEAVELEQLLCGLPRLAFYDALRDAMVSDGLDLEKALLGEDVRVVLDYLLSDRGLDYAALPKALLLFHRYDGERRTPIEEHMAEAIALVRDAGDRCRLHFTVSEEHLPAARARAARAAESLCGRFGVRFEIDFSLQKLSTDSLAVASDGGPFRDAEGRLLLRPAGHGALIENLNDLAADIVFLKNIDNVVPDRRKRLVHAWKRALGGLLLETQRTVFAHLQALTQEGRSEDVVRAAVDFLRDDLGSPLEESQTMAPLAARRAHAVELLDRPLRICGMVVNTGEPGGGPFWVGDNGSVSKQIVESAQVDLDCREQKRLFGSATHFNPVDIVCAVRDRNGRPYDLRRYVDDGAYLVVEKSHEGRPLRALERPGLWNGAMAHWNTVFVEVPIETFSPVKSVIDLLRPEHLSE